MKIATFRRVWIALCLLVGVTASGIASAYPASQMFRYNALSTCPTQGPASGFVYSTGVAACQAAGAAYGALASFRAQGGTCSGTPSGQTAVYQSTTGSAPGFSCIYDYLTSGGAIHTNDIAMTSTNSQLSCPNGGTLSGSVCNCTPPQTDSGTGCVDPPACPDGQFLPAGGGPCTNICPSAGRGWNPLDGDGTDYGFNYPQGQSSACLNVTLSPSASADGLAKSDTCRVVPTSSIIVCADYGSGSICTSEDGRYTGTRCAVGIPTNVPDTATTCDVGDVWCYTDTGSCAAGFVGGTFNGRTICTKKGEPVNVIPQPDSVTSPPYPSEPGQTDPPTQDGEGATPDDRVTVGVGSGAVTGPGNGTGSGSGEDIITCGLPDTPKCKIDETGTPTGEGVDTEARAGVNEEAGKLTTKLEQVLAGEGAPDRSWGFSISFPNTCTPFEIGTARWGFFDVDFCQWQPVIHDIMSLIWVGVAVFLSIGLVIRTVSAG